MITTCNFCGASRLLFKYYKLYINMLCFIFKQKPIYVLHYKKLNHKTIFPVLKKKYKNDTFGRINIRVIKDRKAKYYSL